MLLTPRWVGRAMLLVVVVVSCGWLGSWQWDVAHAEPPTPPDTLTAAFTDIHQPGRPVDQDQVGRRVWLSGTFDEQLDLVVVDRLNAERAGTWVLSAFEVEGSDGAVVPIVRGWLPLGATVPPVPPGHQDLVGWLEPTEPDLLREQGREPLPAGQVEIVSSAELLSLWDRPLYQGFVIQQKPAVEPPLVGVSPPSLAATQHVDWQNLAYAIQWWIFGLFAIFWFVRIVRVEREDLAAGADDSTSATLDTMAAHDEDLPRRASE